MGFLGKEHATRALGAQLRGQRETTPHTGSLG